MYTVLTDFVLECLYALVRSGEDRAICVIGVIGLRALRSSPEPSPWFEVTD